MCTVHLSLFIPAVLQQYYVSGCTGTVIGVEGFDSLSQIYFDNMFRPLLGHLQVIQFWRMLVCNVSHILILYCTVFLYCTAATGCQPNCSLQICIRIGTDVRHL
jgi:hypothetical protein